MYAIRSYYEQEAVKTVVVRRGNIVSTTELR